MTQRQKKITKANPGMDDNLQKVRRSSTLLGLQTATLVARDLFHVV